MVQDLASSVETVVPWHFVVERQPLPDRMLLSFVRRAPGWSVVAVALLFYPVFGLVVPLILGWRRPFLIEANLAFTVLAAVVTIGWFVVRDQEARRRNLLEWTSNLRLLDSSEFEWLVGELFRRDGWEVRETGNANDPDGNIDLELSRPGEHRIVQCKRWESWNVGVDPIRRFLGTLLREGLPASAGIFVTLSQFGRQAREEAEQAGLTLIDNADLHERIDKVKQVNPCPDCDSPMVFGRSTRGWWFHCVRPGCQGKQDLGGDPARVVELLTIQPPIGDSS